MASVGSLVVNLEANTRNFQQAMQRNADSPGIAALVRMLQSHED